jgi:hypothetical protein
MESPISMRNGTFNTSKCRGKLQKMGVLYTHSPKSRSPFSILPKKQVKKILKIAKNWESHSLSRPVPRPAGDLWLLAVAQAPFFVHCGL